VVDFCLIYFLEDQRINRSVAVGRVKYLPVTAGEFQQEREAQVSHAANERHGIQHLVIGKAVSFCIISSPFNNRANQVREVGRIHLPVSIHLHDHRGA